ncbi:TetR/AcrR family transcriptional regulator [Agrobacterium radiobacter]|uniref:TetR/AcrR family transcriptional regulator n=1 Tax=Agrobacterium radiobacter TaxID=362 RepID=UPI003F86DC0F
MKKTTKYAEGEAPRDRIISAARKLFGAKGFHATTTAELAAEASVSMGQIYRHFSAKDDIVLTIAEENTRERIAAMNAIFDTVENGERTAFDTIKAIVAASLEYDDEGLAFEILAEASRNPSVAERFDVLLASYREGVRRLANLARPDVPECELNAYVDIMMACMIGLGYRSAAARDGDIDTTSENTARLLMRALGLSDKSHNGRPV